MQSTACYYKFKLERGVENNFVFTVMKSFIIWFMFYFLDSADTLCSQGGYHNSQPQFGPRCMYRCHCVDDVQCDYITGNCPKGCAAGWMGPGCQYGDIAYKKQVKQFLYSGLFINGTNATDGLPTTCVGPTTLVERDLNATYRISGLVINSSDAVNLTGYEVKVGNYSSDPSSDIFHTCLKQTVTKKFDTSTDVLCATEIVGRYILIRTPDNATTMTLCDVRVYGGRSLAYGHSGSQNTTNDTPFGYAVAERALDGNTNTSFRSYSCTHTLEEMSPWWRVNLAAVYNIARIVLYGRSDCCTERLSGFSVSFATNSSFNLVFKYPMKTPPLETEVITLSENNAQHVEISLKDITQALTLCEVFVFGDCKDDMCGWTCDIFCHCEGPIEKKNIIDANCSSGCKSGWYGHSCNNTCDRNCNGTTCNQTNGYCLECYQGKWGHFCDKNCINCLQGTGYDASDGIGSCYQDTGACIHGCQPGWQEENCTIACPLGWYGKNCNATCGHCANTTCDHINGTCPFGCSEGYNGTRCYEPCPFGLYGINCSNICGHCANTMCDHINGTCPFGCSEGYNGTSCSERCHVGWYGKNCSTICGHCANTTCDHINGTCPFGCSEGYTGTRCNESCPVGMYGTNCSTACGHCANTTCDHINGTCPFGCYEGYNGTKCSERCQVGWYGTNCSAKCGHCANTKCDHINGSCLFGCSDGYNGTRCSEPSSCPKGGYNNSQPQFGPGCMYRCHCVDDVQCDYTGNCPRGCAAGWMGPGCQYADIAYNKKVQQLLYGSNLFIDGTNATDGLPTTCLGPTTWVVIDLNANYRISGLVINSSDAVNLTGYEVSVGNYSSDPSSAILHTCFKQNITHQLDTSTDVVCTTEIVGQYLLIRTPDNATTINLCDVRVYGGRSLAYQHNGSQSTTYNSDFGFAAASRASDGNTYTSFRSNSCTHTLEEMSPWWRVNLALVYNIARIVLYGRSDCCTERLSGFSVSFATNSSFTLTFKYPEKTPPLITEVITLSENNAQHVEISLKNITKALTLCEVFVFGDCQDNMCGWTCDIVCHCEGPIAKQNIIDANCTSGCKTGWWGHSCNNTCASNCKGNTCNQTDGYCLGCAQGKWGHFCDNNCTNCLHGTGCGASDGICSVECLKGLFGVSCGEHCGQCAEDGSCNRYTGACIHGCQLGWQEDNCTIGMQQEETSTESSSSLPIGIPVGGALGALGFTTMIIVVAIIFGKRRQRAPETSEIEHIYDQIDSTRVLHEKLSDYSKIEELGLSPVIPKENTYENTLSEKNLIPKCEFRDNYRQYISLDDKTGELRLLSVFNSIPSPAPTKTEVTRTGRADDCIETLNKSYLFQAMGKKEFTILSDFPTTSEAIWRLALEHRIHLIIIIGENRIPLKPKVQVDIGLIQIECIDINVARDLLLCNINVSECEKDTKVRNVQVIVSAEECSFCIPSNINETVAVLKKRLCMRQGIEAFNTLINCTPDATDGECFVASLLMTDVMERSGYIDIIGIIEAMRKEKHDAINSFDKFKFCHDVIFKWIVDEENKRRMGELTSISSVA